MVSQDILIKRGIIRRCRNCFFRTSSRQEMRAHERSLNHVQDMRGVDEAKQYTPEERVQRAKR